MVKARQQSSRLRAASAAIAGGAAGLAFAGAVGMAAVALFDLAPMQLGLPWFDAGIATFGVNPLRAALLAPLLLAAAAVIAAIGSPGGGLYGLIVVAVLTVTAHSAFGAAFFGLIALLLGCWARVDGAFSLSAVPVVLLVLAMIVRPIAFAPPLLVVAGCVALVAGGFGGARAATMRGFAVASAAGFSGLSLVALGLSDESAAMRAVMANALIAPMLGLVAMVLERSTGTSALDWLGGLARGMSRFALLALGSVVFAASLPPGPGFAPFGMVWRVAAMRGAWPVMVVLALWFGLIGFAGVRCFAAVALGRPRSLRAAAAEDAPPPVLLAMAVLLAGGLCLAMATQGLGLLMVMMLIVAGAAMRFLTRSGPIDVAAFEDGFARPPAWLPFGDPATQISATAFAAVVVVPRLGLLVWRRSAAVVLRCVGGFRL